MGMLSGLQQHSLGRRWDGGDRVAQRILVPLIFDLVGGWATPLKNMSSPVGMIIPNIWKNNPNVPNHQPMICFNYNQMVDVGFKQIASWMIFRRTNYLDSMENMRTTCRSPQASEH